MTALPRCKLGSQGMETARIGLGCMGMSGAYTSSQGTEEESIKVIQKAIEAGCMLDTSDVYGPFKNEELIGRAIAGLPRDKITIATKFGISFNSSREWKMTVDGSRKYAREACLASLKRLGVDYIDLYYIHRKDPKVPIEETMAELKLLVEEGKIKYIGLSETSAEDIRRAHAIHPITAIQLEWSLWTRDCEAEIVPLCRELGIGIVPYSPLGRGFLTGRLKREDLADSDYRSINPRFQEGIFDKNLELVKRVTQLANTKNATPGQMALAWLLAQGGDVAPIPGTRRLKYLEENLQAATVTLTEDELRELTTVVDQTEIIGERAPEAVLKMSYSHYVNETTA